MRKIEGIPASSGFVVGSAFLWGGDEIPEIPRYSIKKAQISAEWERLKAAQKALTDKLRQHIESLKLEKNKEHIEILKAHLMMLEDLPFFEQLKLALEKQLTNIEWILWSISHETVQKLLSAQDAYLRERAVDIADMSHSLLARLLSITQVPLSKFNEDVIIVAREIPPSQAMSMDRQHIKAIVTDVGTKTSHTSILARSFEIPAVVGCSNASFVINSGDILLVDGDSGIILVNPTEEDLNLHKEKEIKSQNKTNSIQELKDLPAETKDGRRFALLANTETPAETEKIFNYGAQGIGLFRSEFLFLNSGEPMEEERQYRAYCEVLKKCGNLPVTIRTVDVGGDKISPNFFPREERNPLLGWRAIRFSLSMPELFKVQLRAILRAAVHGNVRIMFPMISCIEELESALAILEEAKAECRMTGVPVAEHIKTGCMIEVPSAAIMADALAKKSGFFSIGTNDLMQYTLAIDRGNEKVSYLAKNLQPALLRLVKNTIDEAHKAGIEAAMCGEMAGDPLVIPVLIGLGLDAFSTSATLLPEVKRIIRESSYEACKKLADEAVCCDSCTDIEKLIQKTKL
ncbi:MAG: phosphoenolpyruvate--protein phosphotransferase [Spirochaetaceae bacterium]|jgi:phosphotransferase system enzyme I (PtsI)|nr:phosphoenolpyruvate--protein phosphotransferase [Spirochaetaceae bacterium]